MERIEALLRDLEESQRATEELKTKIGEAVFELAAEVRHVDVDDTLNYLYWMMPSLKTTVISEAFFGKTHELRARIKPLLSDFSCDRCGNRLAVDSRSKMLEIQRRAAATHASWAEGYSIVCAPCEKAIYEERHREGSRWWEERKQRLEQLRSMPYREYLQTPEWLERRKHHLKSAGYRCQVCNKNGLLNVHHRTYERRGEEYYKDLIVLCAGCHTIFHEQGKLAQFV